MQINRKRVGRVVAILAVAFAAGHFVQSLGPEKPPQRAKVETLQPKSIVTLAASAGNAAPKPAIQPESSLTAPVTVSLTAQEAATAAPEPEVAAITPAADPCQDTLNLSSEPGHMIAVLLLSPCHIDERVVLRHGGLAITGRTTGTGAMFTTLPALEIAGQVSVMFRDGDTVSAAIAMPELARIRRFGVQWQADDAFQLHAFEAGADFGTPGHVSQTNAKVATIGAAPGDGGYLNVLGDVTTERPLLAQIYTFPADGNAKVLLEAAVTQATCGRELLGETLVSSGGAVVVTELTLAMPGCDAIGGFLVLKNIAPDMKIALAN